MRADRLLSMLLLLQIHGRLTAAELADRLEVSERTIYRDMDALSAAGVPIYAERGPSGGLSLLESYRTTLNGLHQDEVRALFALTVSGLLGDLGIDESSESARLKVLASLPSPLQREAQRVQKRLYLDPAAWFQASDSAPCLDVVQEAVWNDRRLRMKFHTRGGSLIKLVIDPYGMVAKAGVWYVVGASFGQVRVYRVSRIEEAALAEGTFEWPEDFDLHAFWETWRDSFEASKNRFDVTVRVAPGAATKLVEYMGEDVYRRLAEAPLTGNPTRSQINLSFSSLEDAAHQLLGFGPAVEVIAPPELRDYLRFQALRIADLYAGDAQYEA